MATPLRVGIIGLGHLHPRTCMPHFEATLATKVVAASDPVEPLRAGFEKAFGVLGRIAGCEGLCAAGGVHRYLEGHAGWMLKRKKSGVS